MLRLPDEAVFKENVHRRHLKEFLQKGPCRQTDRMMKNELVLLCFTNRCGSNLLCDLLFSTGHFNRGGEFLNFDTIQQNVELHHLSTITDYMDFLFGLAVNGRLICKASIDQIVLLARIGYLDRDSNVRFVYVERGDILGQAVSLAIAEQTGQWASFMNANIEPEKASYSSDTLSAIVTQIAKEDYLFKLFFGLNGITPHIMTYEDLFDDPVACVSKLCRQLGVPDAHPKLHDTILEKQANGTNDEWRRRYLSPTVFN